MVTLPMSTLASVTDTGIPAISTRQDRCGVRTSLFGPVTLQVIVKLSPAVGVPGINMSERNRSPGSAVHQ